MYVIIGIALLLIIVIVLDCIRYKHTQSQRINDAEHIQRFVTNNRNGWNDGVHKVVLETKLK